MPAPCEHGRQTGRGNDPSAGRRGLLFGLLLPAIFAPRAGRAAETAHAEASRAEAPSQTGAEPRDRTEDRARLTALERQVSDAVVVRSGPEDAHRLVRLDGRGSLDPSLLSAAHRYDVRRFGAIWDGQSHPLSERFATLAEARVAYPHANALTNEIDWAATQAAIDRVVLDWQGRAAGTLVFGGTVHLPPGTGRFNRPLTLPFRQVYAVEISPSVSVSGEGRTATGLDFGAAVDWSQGDSGAAIRFRQASVAGDTVVWTALSASDRADDVHETADCTLSSFFMIGPGYYWGYPAPESRADFTEKYGFDAGESWKTAYNAARPAILQIRGNFDAIELPDRVSMQDISINGFRAGIRLSGGQRMLERVRVFNCHVGLHLTRNFAHHGDFSLIKCDISGRFACVFLEPGACWFASAFTTIFNQSPFAFYKAASPDGMDDASAVAVYGDHWPGLLQHSSFLHCQFESIGNTLFCDGNPRPRANLAHVALRDCACVEALDCSFPPTAGHPLGDIRRRASIVDAGSVDGFVLENPMAPDRWPFRKSMFRSASGFDAARIEGLDGFLATGAERRRQVFEIGHPLQGAEIRLRGRNWTGRVCMTAGRGQGSGIIARHDLVGLCERFAEPHCTERPGILGVAMESDYDLEPLACVCIARVGDGALDVNADAGSSGAGEGDPDIDVTWSRHVPGKVRAAGRGDPVIGRRVAGGAGAHWTCVLF